MSILLSSTNWISEMSFNTFFAFYADGSSQKVEFPSDWSIEDVKKAMQTDDIMGPYPVKED